MPPRVEDGTFLNTVLFGFVKNVLGVQDIGDAPELCNLKLNSV